jgi:hypothetical protein
MTIVHLIPLALMTWSELYFFWWSGSLLLAWAVNVKRLLNLNSLSNLYELALFILASITLRLHSFCE